MAINIRKGLKSDLPEILILIKELAKYENSLDEVTITIEDLEKDGFNNNPLYWFIVAENEEKIIGMSFYFIRYSTWKGKFLFLEDFIVSKSFRRNGVGSMLFEKTILIAQEMQVNGMIWQVLDWNDLAINFYNKYNAKIDNQWLNGKLTKSQINSFKKNEGF